MWFRYPMKGFPQYKDRIWEWDFKPTGDRSATRPGWRVFAFIPDPTGHQPILARPFLCWDKNEAPRGNEVPFIVEALKKFLGQRVEIAAVEERFRRQLIENDTAISLCLTCYQTVGIATIAELDVLEDAHQCDPANIAN